MKPSTNHLWSDPDKPALTGEAHGGGASETLLGCCEATTVGDGVAGESYEIRSGPHRIAEIRWKPPMETSVEAGRGKFAGAKGGAKPRAETEGDAVQEHGRKRRKLQRKEKFVKPATRSERGGLKQ